MDSQKALVIMLKNEPCSLNNRTRKVGEHGHHHTESLFGRLPVRLMTLGRDDDDDDG